MASPSEKPIPAGLGKVVRMPFDQALEKAQEALKKEGFGVLTRIDVKATLRRNIAHDGALIDPRWRRIRKDRPRLVAICDISRSVSQYSRFLLMFLYSLQEVIPRLRTFVFTSSMHEVTALFEQADIGDALDIVMDRYGLGSSDYGRALADLDSVLRTL